VTNACDITTLKDSVSQHLSPKKPQLSRENSLVELSTSWRYASQDIVDFQPADQFCYGLIALGHRKSDLGFEGRVVFVSCLPRILLPRFCRFRSGSPS
jgi:hypothetical protein